MTKIWTLRFVFTCLILVAPLPSNVQNFTSTSPPPPQPATLLRKALVQVFSVNFTKFLRTPFLQTFLQTAPDQEAAQVILIFCKKAVQNLQ